MRGTHGLRRIRIVIGLAAVLALAALALGLQRDGMARQQEHPAAISLNAPTGFPVDI